MGYQSLQMTPGIDVEKSALLNSAGWSASMAVRFRDGIPEKIGGWARMNQSPLVGICTGMHTFADLSGNLYIFAGTDQRLEVFLGGLLYDITPIRATTNNAPQLSTTTGSKVVNVKDVGNGAQATDWVNITVPVAVGGLIIQGFYQIQTIVDADNYTILAATAATGNVTNGGAVPVFDSTMGSADVQVTLANHGLLAGGTFPVEVATTVGGIVIGVGTYGVIAPVAANTFTIAPAGLAGSTQTVSENSGNARIEYLISTGLQSASFASGGGYGVGAYGAGAYGTGSTTSTVVEPLRQWWLDNFGEDLIGNYTFSPMYVWVPPIADGNVAIPVDTSNFPGALDPPQEVVFSFVSDPQQMVIAGGCTVGNTSNFDPNLLRWCDQSDFTDWQALATNQAGSYRIPTGSKLVGGLSAPNFTVVWTDIDMWLMSYLGGTGLSGLVWGFSKVARASGLLAGRACAVFRNLVFYASSNGIYVFDGNRITLIPCPVWDKFWKNLNRMQVDKVNMQVNSYFQEVSLAFPSAAGNGTVDSRITYNIRENLWTYDDAPTLTARTAWIDENVYGSLAGTDLAGFIQQQDTEGVYDADGSPLVSSIQTGWFAVQEGDLVQMMERLEADAIIQGGTGNIQITVYAKDYATESAQYPVSTYGPYTFNIGSGPPMNIIHARGRFMSIKISSTDLGVFWRLGRLRYIMKAAGRRP